MPSVAIVGSGPSGLFTAKNLFRALKFNVNIDIFEKHNAPFGLLQFGVAPDHPEIKKKFMTHFKPLFEEAGDYLRLFLNANVGTDIQVETLKNNYDIVVLCTGMSNSVRTWPFVPGTYGADQIVGWYNGAPEFKNSNLDLSKAINVVIVGNGNVALDIVRILSQPVEYLENTDINPVALNELKRSNVRNITILGRRGPLEMSFTPAELRELVALKSSVTFSTSPADLSSYFKPENTRIQDKNLKILQNLVNGDKLNDHQKQISFRFFETIDSIDAANGVVTIKDKHSATHQHKFNILIEAIGFYQKSKVYPPFQDSKGKFSCNDRHLVDSGIYACGWSRTGPKGTIADSMVEAENCARQIVEDLANRKSDPILEHRMDLKQFTKWTPFFK